MKRGFSLALFLLVVVSIVGVACAPAATPTPTTAATKAAESTNPAPAATKAAEPAKPAATASPAAKPATSPAASPATKPAAGLDWKADWDQIVAAAKKEGKVAVAGPPGDLFRAALVKDFQAAFPGITVDYLGGRGVSDLAPRILAEQRAGNYLWDVINVPAGYTARTTFIPADALTPLRGALILPDVLDDSKWGLGFAANFRDHGEHLYEYGGTLSPALRVNRDFVSKDELISFDDALNPKWKGKIASVNMSTGTVRNNLMHRLIVRGEDWLRKLLDQDITIIQDPRMLTEALVRGSKPIAMGVRPTDAEPFVRDGLFASVETIGKADDPKDMPSAGGDSGVALPRNPPHPNAQKVFINWLLSREGQQAVTTETGLASYRVDVQVSPDAADLAPRPGVEYVFIQEEKYDQYNDKWVQILSQYPQYK